MSYLSRIHVIAFGVAALLAAHTAKAADFSFTGTFATDDQIQLFNLNVTADSTVTFQSWGYGGGVNAAAMNIAPGGFDSYFSWFTADGTQIGTNDDGCGNAGSNNGACLDAYASVFLPAGGYILALTESPNAPNGDLSDGFDLQGTGNFSCPQGFCDTFGNQDNGNWAVDILNVQSAAEASSPEPMSFILTGCGLSLLGLIRRRRNV